jgi:hypothetical protein
MSDTATPLAGPDLAMGVSISKIAGGAMLMGHANVHILFRARGFGRACVLRDPTARPR